MAKNYGDLPCVNINGTIHLTVSAKECACGASWHYGVSDRKGKFQNIIWRDAKAITCQECLKKIEEKTE